jgi:hypothetical protein
MNEEDFIDASAMLNLLGIIIRGNVLSNHYEDALEAYSRACKLWECRNRVGDEEGIVAIKKRVNRKVKNGSD